MTIDRVSGAVLVLVGLFVAWERRVLPLGSASRPGPGYVSLILAIVLIVLGAILIAHKDAPEFRQFWDADADRLVKAVRNIGKVQ